MTYHTSCTYSRSSICFFFFSSRRRHTRLQGDWSSDVCSSDLKRYVRRQHGSVTSTARTRRAHAGCDNNSGNHTSQNDSASTAETVGLDGTNVGEGDSGFDVLTSRPVATDQCIGVENGVPKDQSRSVSSGETQSTRGTNGE